MANQRYIPYGYHIKDGEIQIDYIESEIIKMIFDLYLEGNSYLSISRILNEKEITYSDVSMWNKNNVGRIIKNANYADGAKYTPIITKDIFKKAQSVASDNYSKKNYKADEINVELKKVLYCDSCKSRLNSKYGKWICTKCDTSACITHASMKEGLVKIYNNLIENISLIETPQFTPYAPDMGVKRMENELNRCMDSSDIDKVESLNAIFGLADARYMVCDDGSNGRNGTKIKECLRKHHTNRILDMELVNKTIDKIIVQPDDDFYILLKNGQEIK